MFESAELGHKVAHKEFTTQASALREALLQAQYELLAAPRFPVVVLIGGVDGAGKGETVNVLNAWMDPRHIRTYAFGDPSDEEAERPRMWRYWRALPPKGHIGILFGSWYTEPIVDRVMGSTDDTGFAKAIDEIRHFERMLAADGTTFLKLWFHLSKPAQEKRLKALEADKHTRWRVTDEDWKRFQSYDKFRAISEVMLRETSSGEAPWHIIEGEDSNYRSLAAATLLLDALKRGLANHHPAATPAPVTPLNRILDHRNVLNSLDYQQKIDARQYDKLLEEYQGKLALLTRHKRFRRHALTLVFEGQDAAGKGSTIRRITGALDARFYHIIPIAAPTQEERAQPYLWRFWRHLPRLGRVIIFDRSWYGRVLVERVEKLCADADWLRAYQEINEFEDQLTRRGAIIVKFWLAITKEEQLARFQARETTPFKSFKITPEDWRNREKWADYEQAVCDMVERTSTNHAPWHLIPTNDKLHGRIAVLKTICEALDETLKKEV